MDAIAVDREAEEISLVDHPEPHIESTTEVKLEIIETGICGTDREIASFEYGTPPDGSRYLIIGHEAVGRVVDTGEDVDEFEEGDLAVPMVRRPCPHEHCSACVREKQDFCYTGDFSERGIKERHGFMAEYVVDQKQFMVPVPQRLKSYAALVEPLTIAEKALIQLWDIQERLPWLCQHHPEEEHGKGAGRCHSALVLGAGPVGVLGALALKVSGFDTRVYSLREPPNEKSRLLAKADIDYVSSSVVSREELKSAHGRYDLIYEATGASQFSFECTDLLDRNGVYVFTGVPGRKQPVEIQADDIMRDMVLNNQVFLGTVNAGRPAYEKAIKDLAYMESTMTDALSEVISGRYSPDRVDLLEGSSSGIKNLIEFSDTS